MIVGPRKGRSSTHLHTACQRVTVAQTYTPIGISDRFVSNWRFVHIYKHIHVCNVLLEVILLYSECLEAFILTVFRLYYINMSPSTNSSHCLEGVYSL